MRRNKELINTLILRSLVRIVVNIICLIQSDRAPKYWKTYTLWFDRLDSRIKNHGLPWAIKLAKEERLLFFQFLSGSPLRTSNIPKVGLSKKGLPKHLNLESMDFNNPWDLRFVTTLLSVTRFFRLPPVPDLTAVTDPYKGPFSNVEQAFPSSYEIKRALSSLISSNFSMKLSTDHRRFHTNNRSSPLGVPSLVSSVVEAYFIVREYPDLLKNIEVLSGSSLSDKIKLCGCSGLPKTLISFLKLSFTFKDILTKKLKPVSSKIRRISVIPDKEGKSRIICLLDYWSQNSLKPIHDYFLKVLRSIPSDMTYDQADLPLSTIGDYVQSADLTSATDRFPVLFQELVLSHFVGPDKARAWRNILTYYPFEYQGSPYTYGVGQPLGAYSSWAVFAFCHHVIVRIAIMRRYTGSLGWNELYRILGDDIVIFDKDVSDEYFIILERLGVEVSKSKTFTSGIFFELAKRQFRKIDGKWVEVTAFPFGGLPEAIKTPPQFYQYMNNICHKGWEEVRSLLCATSTIVQFVKLFPYLDSPSRYARDFTLSQFSVTNVQQARLFLEGNRELYLKLMFGGYDPEDYVLGCFHLAESRAAMKELLHSTTYQVEQQFKVLIDQVDNSSSLEFGGTGVDPIPEGTLPYDCIPYITIWEQGLNNYRSQRYTFTSAIRSGQFASLIEKGDIQYRGLPDIDAVRMVSRDSKIVNRQLKIIKDVLTYVIHHPLKLYLSQRAIAEEQLYEETSTYR